jgi:hypothetical protein
VVPVWTPSGAAAIELATGLAVDAADASAFGPGLVPAATVFSADAAGSAETSAAALGAEPASELDAL